MRNRIIALMMVAAVSGGFCLTGCGGGGGGGGTSSTSYKGNTAQAVVTASNAEALTVDALDDVQNATAIGVIGKSLSGVSAPPRLVAIANTIENSIVRMQAKSAAKTVASSEQGTEYGYSGSFSYSGNYNESTGVFSGSISFNKYRETADAAELSGSITFTGAFNQATGEFTSLSITVSGLQGSMGSEAFVMNGSMSLTNAGLTQTMSMSMVLLDVAKNQTYWLKDFNMVFDGNTMSISGTYYDHIYGYVVISTLTPLTVSSYSGEPTSGQLLFSGSNGTKARLTYTYTGYILEVDETGNNTFIPVP